MLNTNNFTGTEYLTAMGFIDSKYPHLSGDLKNRIHGRPGLLDTADEEETVHVQQAVLEYEWQQEADEEGARVVPVSVPLLSDVYQGLDQHKWKADPVLGSHCRGRCERCDT